MHGTAWPVSRWRNAALAAAVIAAPVLKPHLSFRFTFAMINSFGNLPACEPIRCASLAVPLDNRALFT
jgi:hypothetical protein